jgi:hypothetical protein
MSIVTLTIGQLLEIAPGAKGAPVWINDPFEGVVTIVKQDAKKATLSISDPHSPHIKVGATVWARDCGPFAGCLCYFSGQGMSRTEFKGAQEVTLGEKATIQVVGRPPAGGMLAPAPQSAPAPAPRAASAGPGRSAGPSAPIHGATVGAAINQAIGIIRDSHPQDSYYESPKFSKDLHVIASDIIRVALYLESGHLATPAKDRAKEEAPAPAPAPTQYVRTEPTPPPQERPNYVPPEPPMAYDTVGIHDGFDQDVPF